MAKGFRNQEVKNDIVKKIKNSLTEEEARRIEDQRRFENIEPNTHTWKIALHLDSLRKQFRDEQMTISKRLWNIENIQNSIDRCNLQISTKEIYEKLPDSNVIMNEYELKTYIKHQEWLKLGEVRAIAPSLAKIRGIVGHKDYVGQDILTDVDFDKYVNMVELKLKALNHSLYD